MAENDPLQTRPMNADVYHIGRPSDLKDNVDLRSRDIYFRQAQKSFSGEGTEVASKGDQDSSGNLILRPEIKQKTSMEI